MDEFYKRHHISSHATLNPETNRWTPKVTISWDESGMRKMQNLDGPVDHSGSEQDANTEGVQLGRKWIDDGKPDLRK